MQATSKTQYWNQRILNYVAVHYIVYSCYAQTMDLGQSVDCPAETVDPRFTQTIHGLSQAQHD